MSHSDRNSTNNIRLTSSVSIELSNFLAIDFVEFGVHHALSVHHILLKQVLGNLEARIGLLNVFFR